MYNSRKIGTFSFAVISKSLWNQRKITRLKLQLHTAVEEILSVSKNMKYLHKKDFSI